MKYLWYICVIGCLSCSQQVSKSVSDASMQDQVVGFDAELAAKVGADEYGMKSYVMAFLKRGPNRDQPQEERDNLQRAHMANINRLAKEGVLVLAGPFLDDGDLRGIYIFDVRTIDEAEALTKTDPAIQAGSLVMELHPWYGSAATMMIGEWHDRLQKTKF